MKSNHRFLFLLLLLLTLKTTQRLATADPNDEACLTNLHKNLQDPSKNLHTNWTKPIFSNPCSGFTSYLPEATCNNGRIYKLSLTNLSLRGTISPFLSNCTNLQSLDLSSNQISGEIPTELKLLVNLAVLNLSSNRLSGQIPPQLALCVYLNVIDVHNNELSGSIPEQFGMLARLSAFDVSNNKFSGQIPASLGRFNTRSFVGNKKLFGFPLEEKKRGGLSVMAIVGIGLGSGLVSLVISFCGVCIWLRITEKKMEAEQGKITNSMPVY